MNRLGCLRQSVTKFFKCDHIYVRRPKSLQYWFGGCAGMCALTIGVGGVTRLTESGLSLTDWKFIGDIFLPQNEEQWSDEFEKYKKFPEWIRLNKEREMNINEFKFIYFMEYLHRNCGKATGLAFIAPLPFLWTSLSKIGKLKSLGLGSLLGFQGFLGWYMVRSGLDEDILGKDSIPRVSHYRLAIHLSAALLLYSGFVWSAMDCSKTKHIKISRVRPLAFTMLGLVSSTITT